MGQRLVDNRYEPHSCGGEIIDEEPCYIPIGPDNVMEIIDQRCTKCGCHIVGKYQRTRIIKNQKVHDLLNDALTKKVR